MRLLFLGDVMGRSGRVGICDRLQGLRDRLKADMVVVNAENATSGAGLSVAHAKLLLDAGAPVGGEVTVGVSAMFQVCDDTE